MLFVLAALILDAPPPPPDRPALTVRLVRPRVQWERLIALFEGSRAPHPAAALAGYKRAKGGDTGLGKAVEAAIASINPGMAAEMATLDDATFGLGGLPKAASPGRRSSPATTAPSPPTRRPPSSPTARPMTRSTASPSIAWARRPPPRSLPGPRADSCSRVRASNWRPRYVAHGSRCQSPPSHQAGACTSTRRASSGASLPARRVGLALTKLGCSGVDASIGLEEQAESMSIDVFGRFAAPPAFARATIPFRWLRAIPTEGAVAIFAIALDPSPEAWIAAFDVLDAVEKADPARANVAPARLRLNLLARPRASVPTSTSGPCSSASRGPSGSPPRARSTAWSSASTRRTRPPPTGWFRPRSAAWSRRSPALREPRPTGRPSVKVAGRPVAFERKGPDVVISWGRPPRPASGGLRIHPANLDFNPEMGGETSALRRLLAGATAVRRRCRTPRPSSGRDASRRRPPSTRSSGRGSRQSSAASSTGSRSTRRPTPRRPRPRRLNPMRLIDLHVDWLLQYAGESTIFDPADFPDIAQLDRPGRRLPRRDLGRDRRVLPTARPTGHARPTPGPPSTRSSPGSRPNSPAASSATPTTSTDGRRPRGPRLGDDRRRGLRSPDPLRGRPRPPAQPPPPGRPPLPADLHGVSLLAGSSAPGDDRGLLDLGRRFLERLAEHSDPDHGPRPIVDLAHLNPSAAGRRPRLVRGRPRPPPPPDPRLQPRCPRSTPASPPPAR